MPKRKAPTNAPSRKRRSVRKQLKFRRKGSARPMRSLRTSYKGIPNQYRFVRETVPETLDLGQGGTTSGITLVASSGTGQNIARFDAPFLSFNDMVNTSDFDNLYANFKIDKIETHFIPMWHLEASPNLDVMITRVNTKYLVNGFPVRTSSEAYVQELAQLQMKSRSRYTAKRGLVLTTWNPRVFMKIKTSNADGTDVETTTTMDQPWLSLTTQAGVEFSHNDVFFAQALNGENLTPGTYKYRIYHKIFFRCSYVG